MEALLSHKRWMSQQRRGGVKEGTFLKTLNTFERGNCSFHFPSFSTAPSTSPPFQVLPVLLPPLPAPAVTRASSLLPNAVSASNLRPSTQPPLRSACPFFLYLSASRTSFGPAESQAATVEDPPGWRAGVRDGEKKGGLPQSFARRNKGNSSSFCLWYRPG